MKIGSVELENNVFLAPMAGVTDRPFRLLCKEMGAGLVYTEMVSAKGMYYDSKNTAKLLETDPKEHPVAVQLFGSDPEIMAQMAKRLEQAPVEIIDINMGCPAPKIVKNGEGSALLKTPKRIEAIVSAVVSAQNKPVTVKIRKGFDDDHINAVEVALAAQQAGACAITVHGRTREQYYSGQADWDIIAQVKEAVSIPVIGNGDVASPQAAKRLMEETGCDAVMIGRAAQGNPWIFREVVYYLRTGELLPPPTRQERGEMALRHARMLVADKGEPIAIREMRRHLYDYTKGMPQAAKLRGQIHGLNTLAELTDLVEQYFLG